MAFIVPLLIEYYAGNLKAFDRLGYIEPHVNANGQPDGMKVGLSRCSALRQAGVRYGDIVQTVNGLPVNNFSQGLAAWVRLRDVKKLTVRASQILCVNTLERCSPCRCGT